MGSVKDLSVLVPPTEREPGRGRFVFSDRYSVFDWGEMPDHIPEKGRCLCLITAYFFEELEKQGIKTHYRGVVEKGKIKKLDDLEQPTDELDVLLYRVIKPEAANGEYDYSVYAQDLVNFLIPLEVIYRNTLPGHSSFRKRVETGEIDIRDYGLTGLPAPGEFLTEPVFDVSTKLEATDRYISWTEAQRIAGLRRREVEDMLQVLETVNRLISEKAEKAGLKNLDGKIELAFDHNRNLVVVDAVGTPDECRFQYDGFSISKEVIRKHYRSTRWYEQVTRAKKEGGQDWRRRVTLMPDPLPPRMLELISQMYMACANEITGRDWFHGVPSLGSIKSALKNVLLGQ